MKTGIAVAALLICALTRVADAAEPAKAPEKSPAAVTAPVSTSKTAAAGKSAPRAADRLDLDATVVTGNRELPKVLYIVPWKKAELGDLPEQPFNTLLDEALAPIDRDEFRREVSYYSKLADRPAAAAPAPSASTGAPAR